MSIISTLQKLFKPSKSLKIQVQCSDRDRSNAFVRICNKFPKETDVKEFINCMIRVLERIDSDAEKLYPLISPGVDIKFELFSSDEEIDFELEILFHAFCRYCSMIEEPDEIKRILDVIVESYNLRLNDLSYYVRQLDRASKHFNPEGYCPKLHKFTCSLYEMYVDFFLLNRKYEQLHDVILKERFNLSPAYLYKACVCIQFVAKQVPNPKLFSIMFGGRVESSLNIGKTTSIGCLTIDKIIRQFFSDQNLNFNTKNLISVLDEFFTSLEANEVNWFLNELDTDNWIHIKKINKKSYEYGVATLFQDSFYEIEPNNEQHSNYPLIAYNNKKYGGVDGSPDHCATYLASRISLKKKFRNYIREYLNLPRIGEGRWISELALLKNVRSNTDEVVVHQWSPSWLGRQKLDIGIPSLKIAFEYNGKQHYEPVDFFGGKEGHKKLLRLDKKKKKLCEENNIRLVIIPYTMPQLEVASLIREVLSTKITNI